MTATATRYEQKIESKATSADAVVNMPEKAIARNLTPAQKRAVAFAQQQILRARAARKAKDDRQAALNRMWANADREDAASDAVNNAERARMVSGEDGQISLRKVIGEVLRNLRTKDHKTLREVSGKAGVSLGYLSEVERGQKEASSELLVSITRALGVPLSDMLMMVADRVREVEGRD
ncbi:XRE family transcriptional regulator [Bifidobacterium margollesii]|uniref:XRE family transcriptional regulator n=1 Tax=Bifidobacterium margollesii TaxID=2020964 RepID=A0A2N5J8G4_9BIFI|nr:XRE family transcriptional regulator [Bifidobacterium margollesii]